MRSRLPLHPSAGEQLLEKSNRVKLELMRGDEGELWADFSVHGTVSSDEDESLDVADFLTFVGRLVAHFTRDGGEGGTP